MTELLSILRELMGGELEPIELVPVVILLWMLWRDRRQETIIDGLRAELRHLVETNVQERLIMDLLRRIPRPQEPEGNEK